MKIRYLTVAALAAGLLAVQPALAQSDATQGTTTKSSTTHTHKKSTKSHKKKSTTAAPATDSTKSQ